MKRYYCVLENPAGPYLDHELALGLWLMDTCAGGSWSVSFEDAVWFDTPELAAVALSDGEQEVNRETCSLVELDCEGPKVITRRPIPWPVRS